MADVPEILGRTPGARSQLVILCPLRPGTETAGPERVAKILAPAIARWFDSLTTDEGRVLPLNRQLLQRTRRASGEYFRGRAMRP